MSTFAAIVFGTFSVFIAQPLLALIPAAGFAALYWASGRRLAAAAAVLWCLYTLYEFAMHRRLLCSGECNIRVDLLLLYPLLWIVSLTALIVGIAAMWRQRNPPAP
jgi:hypothetical protein